MDTAAELILRARNDKSGSRIQKLAAKFMQAGFRIKAKSEIAAAQDLVGLPLLATQGNFLLQRLFLLGQQGTQPGSNFAQAVVSLPAIAGASLDQEIFLAGQLQGFGSGPFGQVPLRIPGQVAESMAHAAEIRVGTGLARKGQQQRCRQDQEARRLNAVSAAQHFIGQLVILAAANAVHKQVGQEQAGEQGVAERAWTNLVAGRLEGLPAFQANSRTFFGTGQRRPGFWTSTKMDDA